jgi:hypothetical protein
MKGSSGSAVVVRVIPHLGNDATFLDEFRWKFPRGLPIVDGIEFLLDDSKRPDVVLVLNYLKYDRVLTARKGGVWRWDNEPQVDKKSLKGFDKLFSHDSSLPSNQLVTASPTLDWWIKKSFEELVDLDVPEKSETVSAIASTKVLKAGHQDRAEFVSRVEKELPSVKVFGQGREQELPDKWDGLASFKYSIAIENTSKPDYWTEKLADCFLSYTVPLYFGATNISDYFPEDSYIWLPIDNPDEAIETITRTIEQDSWEERLPALIEARKRVLHDYSFVAQVVNRVHSELPDLLERPFITKKVFGRRTRPNGWRRGVGLLKNLSLVRDRIARRRQSAR